MDMGSGEDVMEGGMKGTTGHPHWCQLLVLVLLQAIEFSHYSPDWALTPVWSENISQRLASAKQQLFWHLAAMLVLASIW